jgi:NADH-quinone oxidoreductase subunit L
MVAAGVFLIARVYPLMAADQALTIVPVHALTVVAFIGAITALLGACIAVAQNDIKRVLAFSTVSQLGYMMIAIGVGSWVAAIFHLLTHAFFKALLFLGAGSVIHSAHHEQDIRRLGGLSTRMRVTFATFAIGMMALAGVPFLFSGYWSKEAILHAAYTWEVSSIPLVMALIAVALTAFYMTRLVSEVFFGKPRSEAAGHAHESPGVMTVPLVLLAVCAIGLGFLGTPMWPWLQSSLSGTPVEPHSLLEGASLIVLSVLLVLTGIGAGWALYARRVRQTPVALDPVEAAFPRAFAFAAARMKFDELYAATFGRINSGLASLAAWLDRRVWGAIIDSLARFGETAGRFNRETDDDGLNAGFNAASEELRTVGKRYSRAQTGEAHGYLRIMAIGFVVLAILAIIGGGR